MNPGKYLSHYSLLPFTERMFLRLRLEIAPFSEILTYVPRRGNILDVGCGYGLLSAILSFENPDCQITGIDIDETRITVARKCMRDRHNLTFRKVDLTRSHSIVETYQTIICFDIFHHIPTMNQESLMQELVHQLSPRGIFIFKDIDTRPTFKYYWNYMHDRIVTRGQRIYCRSCDAWIKMMRGCGLTIQTVRFPSKGLFYPHLLIVARKN